MATTRKSGAATSARGKAESAAPRKTKSSAKAKPAAAKSASAKSPARKPAAAATIEAADLVGRRAPDFSLPDQDGALVSLRSLTEKGDVVLYFYPKDMTPGCTVEACCFRDAIGKIRALGAQVVGVSADSASSHRRFIDKHGLNFPLLRIHGHRANDVHHRPRRRREKSFSQGQSQRPRRRGHRRAGKSLLTAPWLNCSTRAKSPEFGQVVAGACRICRPSGGERLIRRSGRARCGWSRRGLR
jgi:peroxiredoxin